MTDHGHLTRQRDAADPRSPVYLGTALGVLAGLSFLPELIGFAGPGVSAVLGGLIGGGIGASWRDARQGRPERRSEGPRSATGRQTPPDDLI